MLLNPLAFSPNLAASGHRHYTRFKHSFARHNLAHLLPGSQSLRARSFLLRPSPALQPASPPVIPAGLGPWA